MTDASSKNKKWIVAVQEQPSLHIGRTIGTLIKIKEPRTDDCRDYAIISPQNQNMVKDGDLYLINRIDPLFFYLPTQSIEEQDSVGTNGDDDNKPEPRKKSWQPYNQFLEQSKLSSEVTKFISEKQLQHICSTFENEELYFKFSIEKSLDWLKKKQDTNEVATPHASKTDKSKLATQTDTKFLRIESLQIVCNYLNQTWSKKFVEHMGYTMEEVSNSAKSQTNAAHDLASERNPAFPAVLNEDDLNGTSAKKTAAIQKDREAARTVGNKRLAKVKTKGMKSIGSFFGAVKTKKA
eukprot:CAMPEP_0168203696 /NCGR_PEP_ID=MMETSP0139_2-20121125/24992_1 /TAXON_ID=44445 /ORGANISM="Pseudo-nitzschia australis, Strain 10249 10 AB" /LENGTH=293 /DNA_ID=CAMNT_0008129565 /DNA_START=8 /DNA_END=887 /DNA_ORIENTATION=-